MDTDNLTTLSELEVRSGLRTQLIAHKPRLKSFLGQSKCIVKRALIALLKLVASEVGGKSISLHNKFDKALEEDGKHKSMLLYKK